MGSTVVYYTHTPSPTLSTSILTPIPTFTTPCCQNQVVIQLQTAILIPDYARYYQGPVTDFHPSYIPLGDGSLVTHVFVSDLEHSYALLFLFGVLAMLFLLNLFHSASYLRRTRARTKLLFRMLLVSQLLGFVGILPMILSYFVSSINCTFAVLATSGAGVLSLLILMTGIYGVKVYKCLDNSTFVLVPLVLFSLCVVGLAGLDLSRTRGVRRVSGSCSRSSEVLLTQIYLSLQFAQSLFICFCFLYAVWKSRNSPVARGRMSIRLSMDDMTVQDHQEVNEVHPGYRGWWDYNPDPTTRDSSSPVIRSLSDRSTRTWNSITVPRKPDDDDSPELKASVGVAGEFGYGLPTPRPMSPQISKERSQTISQPRGHGPVSPSISSSSRHLGRYMPSMELFRNVMKDEVSYTATITLCNVLAVTLSIVGVNFTNALPTIGWMSMSWVVTSVLTVHSFGRVIRRQRERDYIVQQAVHWQNELAERSRGRIRAVSRHRNPYHRHMGTRGGESIDQDAQFDETRALTQSYVSWDSRFSRPSSSSSDSDVSSVRLTSGQMVCIPSPTAQIGLPNSRSLEGRSRVF